MMRSQADHANALLAQTSGDAQPRVKHIHHYRNGTHLCAPRPTGIGKENLFPRLPVLKIVLDYLVEEIGKLSSTVGPLQMKPVR
jgi:hypothetical protein